MYLHNGTTNEIEFNILMSTHFQINLFLACNRLIDYSAIIAAEDYAKIPAKRFIGALICFVFLYLMRLLSMPSSTNIGHINLYTSTKSIFHFWYLQTKKL